MNKTNTALIFFRAMEVFLFLGEHLSGSVEE